ncbi:MAG: hypothetical protein E6G90_15980 [Alphaproteobacteria bacterium]|nr:MAG: hypothetical protein E6G90_15980 [Alphaproteobacteria bacterium]
MRPRRGGAASDRRYRCPCGGHPHPGRGAGRGEALEHALDGQSERAFGVDSRSDLARAFSLQPHRSETSKLSSDQGFVEKARDIVGLYLNPRYRSIVPCVDEKSQIQARDRMKPLLPLRPGQPERRTHDYQRHGTASLFAALDVTVGSVIGPRCKRHRAIEFRHFLDDIDANVVPQPDIPIVLDNASSHKDQAHPQLT